MNAADRSYLPLSSAFVCIAMVLIGCGESRNGAPETREARPSVIEAREWRGLFESQGVEGTFVLYDSQTKVLRAHNSSRAFRRFLPASTFKVFNSLVSLQEVAVRSTKTQLKWDGKTHKISSWNRDHDMRSAIRHSVVWFYQEMARRVGARRLQSWMDDVGYGNRKIGAPIDLFWLEGALAISAMEQVDFLRDLYAESLPFDQPVQKEVKAIMLLENKGEVRLFGKTGWAARVSPMIGWFVGFVESGGGVAYFAMNIDMKTAKDAPLRMKITREILKREGYI